MMMETLGRARSRTAADGRRMMEEFDEKTAANK